MIALNLTFFGPSPLWTQNQLSSQFQPSENESRESPAPGSQLSERGTLAERSALVVDDVFDVIDMLSILLTHAGYDVQTASSARDAIMLASQRHFDIIISDIGMPEMNGYELARTLRSLPGYETIPMVAVTGYSMFDDRNRSMSAGFNEHVTKPIDPRAFLDLIEHL